jgi:hypothetical protein
MTPKKIMPPKKVEPDTNRCPQCAAPMQELSYRWNPSRGDFDVFVGCPVCVEPGEAPAADLVIPEAASSPPRRAKARK